MGGAGTLFGASSGAVRVVNWRVKGGGGRFGYTSEAILSIHKENRINTLTITMKWFISWPFEERRITRYTPHSSAIPLAGQRGEPPASPSLLPLVPPPFLSGRGV